jgi:nucleoside-diphosphate-sugar epimerase
MKKILVIGGAGYVGSALVPKLLDNNYEVTVYDLMIYGRTLNNHKNLKIIYGDVRDLNQLKSLLNGKDCIIHLACISNDPSFELNPKLGSEVNFDCFEPLVKLAKNNGVEQFIYASSSSVYGIKNEKDVTENASLDPLTDYSRFKAQCEEVLLKYANNDFISTIVRPATVCGYSKRLRLDLVVNILTNLAYHKKKIKIFGGSQLRPNIHIDDMVDAYLHILNADKDKVKSQIFNVGFENYSVEKLANIVKENTFKDVELEYIESNDNRSYHISSRKISSQIGFLPKKNIQEAVTDLVNIFKKNIYKDTFEDSNLFNIKRMKEINLK